MGLVRSSGVVVLVVAMDPVKLVMHSGVEQQVNTT